MGLSHTQKFSKMKTEEIDGKGVAGLGGGVVPREQYSHHVKRTTFYGVTSGNLALLMQMQFKLRINKPQYLTFVCKLR